jgi:hypothetical protein
MESSLTLAQYKMHRQFLNGVMRSPYHQPTAPKFSIMPDFFNSLAYRLSKYHSSLTPLIYKGGQSISTSIDLYCPNYASQLWYTTFE